MTPVAFDPAALTVAAWVLAAAALAVALGAWAAVVCDCAITVLRPTPRPRPRPPARANRLDQARTRRPPTPGVHPWIR